MIMKLQTEAGKLQRKTEAETQRLAELVALEKQVEAKVKEQRGASIRRRSGGVYACDMTSVRNSKRVHVLEVQRADANRKASLLDLQNEKIKVVINGCRKKLVLYDKVYKRLAWELEAIKRDNDELIAASNEVFGAHGEAVRQKKRLDDLNRGEQEECDMICEQAADMVAKQNQARDFVKTVTQKHAERKAENESQNIETHEEEHILKTRLRELKQGAAAYEAHIRTVDKQLLSAEEAFMRLRRVSGLQSTAEVVRAFVANEDENFSLFNFIQQTNDELSRQKEVLEKISRDMVRFQHEKEQKSEHTYAVINSLKSKRSGAEDAIFRTKAEIAEMRLKNIQICTGVSQMFSHIGCSWGAPLSGSNEGDSPRGTEGNARSPTPGGGPPHTAGSAPGGGNALPEAPEGGATLSNVLVYLGVIEQRAAEVVQQFTRMQTRDKNPTMDQFTNPFGPPHPHDDRLSASKQMQTVHRPTIEEAKHDLQSTIHHGEAIRPLSRFELTARVMDSMEFHSESMALPKIGMGRSSVSLPSL